MKFTLLFLRAILSKIGKHMVQQITKLTFLTRRRFSQGVLGVSIASLFPSLTAFTSTPSDDVFLKVSSIISGIPLDKSYIQLSHRIWDALLKGATEKDRNQWDLLVRKLKTLPDDASSRQINRKLLPLGRGVKLKAQALAKVWYTGRIMRANHTYEVIDYDDALVWKACDFTKPPVTCGGQFGYWHNPFKGKS